MVEVSQVERLRDLQQIGIFRLRKAAALDLPIEYLTAELEGCGVLVDTEPLADFVARPPSPDVGEPIPARLGRGRGDDLDRFRILEFPRQAGDPPVDARTLTVQPNFRVNGEREIDRRRTL